MHVALHLRCLAPATWGATEPLQSKVGIDETFKYRGEVPSDVGPTQGANASGVPSSPPPPLEPRLVLWDEYAYRALTERRGRYDTLIWQTPALAVAAEAFLLTVALNPTVSFNGRAVSSFVGLAIILMAGQLVARNRYLEREDSLLIHELELARERMTPNRYFRYHERPDERESNRLGRARLAGDAEIQNKPGWFAGRQAILVWYAGFGAMAVADLLILIASVLRWNLFS